MPADKGLAGHSDADVLAHAITDAVLGAVAQGDIGRHFPDTDPQWKGASSLAMLAPRRVAGARRRASTSSTSMPSSSPSGRNSRRTSRRSARAWPPCWASTPARVSVKGKTNEGVDAIGRGEAMAVHAVVARSPERG